MRRYFVGFNLALLVVAVALSTSMFVHMRKQDQLIQVQQQTVARLNQQYLRSELRARSCEAARTRKVPMFEFDRGFLNMYPEFMTPPFKRIPVEPPSSWQ
jgi:hypothetical protein